MPGYNRFIMIQSLGAMLKNHQDVLTISESEATVLWCLGAIRHLCKTSVHLILCSKINDQPYFSGYSADLLQPTFKFDGHSSNSPPFFSKSNATWLCDARPQASITACRQPRRWMVELFAVVKGAVMSSISVLMHIKKMSSNAWETRHF